MTAALVGGQLLKECALNRLLVIMGNVGFGIRFFKRIIFFYLNLLYNILLCVLRV